MEKVKRESYLFNSENPLRDLLIKYINRIDELQELKDVEELKKTLNCVINLLPSNVTSFSIPIYYEKEEPAIVRIERESELSKEQQKEWGLSELIGYSVSLDSIGNYNPVD